MNIQQIDKVLHANDVKVCGQLTIVSTLKDGSLLVSDKVGNSNTGFYKVSDGSIKKGFFKKGKFHYSTTNVINFTN